MINDPDGNTVLLSADGGPRSRGPRNGPHMPCRATFAWGAPGYAMRKAPSARPFP